MSDRTPPRPLTAADAGYLASLRAAVEEASNAALRHKPGDPLNFVCHRLLTAGAPAPSERCGAELCEAVSACVGHRPAPPPLTPAAAAAVEAEVQRAIADARRRAAALRRQAPPEGAGRERLGSRHDALRQTDRQKSFERRPSRSRIGRQNSFGSRSGFQREFPGLA